MFRPFGEFGMSKFIIIFVIVLIIFGAKRLPQIGSGLGKGIANFTKAISEDLEEEAVTREPEELLVDAAPEDDNKG